MKWNLLLIDSYKFCYFLFLPHLPLIDLLTFLVLNVSLICFLIFHLIIRAVWCNVIYIFFKYVWVIKCVKIRIILFKNWKLLLKISYQRVVSSSSSSLFFFFFGWEYHYYLSNATHTIIFLTKFTLDKLAVIIDSYIGKIIVYFRNTINAYSLLSHVWWVPLIKFMMRPIIHVRGGSIRLWYSGNT